MSCSSGLLISYCFACSLALLAFNGHFAGIPKGIDCFPIQPAFGYGTSADGFMGVVPVRVWNIAHCCAFAETDNGVYSNS